MVPENLILLRLPYKPLSFTLHLSIIGSCNILKNKLYLCSHIISFQKPSLKLIITLMTIIILIIRSVPLKMILLASVFSFLQFLYSVFSSGKSSKNGGVGYLRRYSDAQVSLGIICRYVRD